MGEGACVEVLVVQGAPASSFVCAVARDTTIVNHSRNGSYGDCSLEAHMWQEEEEVVQAARRCQDMEFT